jgi:hypothetical protein
VETTPAGNKRANPHSFKVGDEVIFRKSHGEASTCGWLTGIVKARVEYLPHEGSKGPSYGKGYLLLNTVTGSLSMQTEEDMLDWAFEIGDIRVLKVPGSPIAEFKLQEIAIKSRYGGKHGYQYAYKGCYSIDGGATWTASLTYHEMLELRGS